MQAARKNGEDVHDVHLRMCVRVRGVCDLVSILDYVVHMVLVTAAILGVAACVHALDPTNHNLLIWTRYPEITIIIIICIVLCSLSRYLQQHLNIY